MPKITNYMSKDYGYESQNYEAIQDANGFMYFSNTNGILEYDNTNWNIFRISGVPRMDIDCSDRIYTAGYNQMGYLKNSRSGIDFVSVIDD
ncbi:MAG: hypothetical protein ACQES1_02800, partial [Bacteroidota bacterium]